MDACIHLGLLEEALFYGLRTMEPYRWVHRGGPRGGRGALTRQRMDVVKSF